MSPIALDVGSIFVFLMSNSPKRHTFDAQRLRQPRPPAGVGCTQWLGHSSTSVYRSTRFSRGVVPCYDSIDPGPDLVRHELHGAPGERWIGPVVACVEQCAECADLVCGTRESGPRRSAEFPRSRDARCTASSRARIPVGRESHASRPARRPSRAWSSSRGSRSRARRPRDVHSDVPWPRHRQRRRCAPRANRKASAERPAERRPSR